MIDLNKPFPFFLNNDRGNFLLVIGISAFTYLFMRVFQPFGAEPVIYDEVPVYSLVTFAVLAFNLLLLPRMAGRMCDNACWTLKRYLWFNVYNVVSVSIVITISHYITRPPVAVDPFYIAFFDDLWKTAAVGIFPLVGITFILENRMLNQALRAGQTATGQLREFRQSKPASIAKRITVQSETRESLELDPATFLYAQAENNYCTLFWKDGEHDNGENRSVSQKLMRLTLKGLEEQIGSGRILRCHRSYLVNLEMVEEVSGNTNGYRLHIPGVEEEIPVSRTLGREILERIDDMSSSPV